ncbi:hypothetical protein [Lentibacter sp.]|uniref:hypothetical protein n=1 Tax=Lentibacter sp. TaxID=2024994 RepID=UPI003F695350
MRRIFAIGAALLTVAVLASCQMAQTSGGAAGGPDATSGRSPLLVAQDCEAAGGRMVVGLAGPQCAAAQPDAGKSCRDNSDCAGFCLAKTRSCTPVTPYFGCHDVLTGGKAATICVD